MKSIAEVLASIPIKADRFSRLADLGTDAMLLRRVEILEQIKRLEEERKEIDAELAGTFSDAELRFGVQFGGGSSSSASAPHGSTTSDCCTLQGIQRQVLAPPHR